MFTLNKLCLFFDFETFSLFIEIMAPNLETGDSDMEYNIEKEEKYEHLLIENKHLVYELKLGVILIIGGIVIVVCILYIIAQCRRKYSRTNRRQNNDQEKLMGSREASEHLIHVQSTEKGKEIFL